MTTFHARVERSGKYWAVQIVELHSWTQARHLREVDVMARDLISLELEVPADSVDLAIDIMTPVDAAGHLARSVELAEQADEARAASAAEVRAAARSMHDQGISMRDVGALLGLSHQRVHQLISAT